MYAPIFSFYIPLKSLLNQLLNLIKFFMLFAYLKSEYRGRIGYSIQISKYFLKKKNDKF